VIADEAGGAGDEDFHGIGRATMRSSRSSRTAWPRAM
jgi:hypothetical protein